MADEKSNNSSEECIEVLQKGVIDIENAGLLAASDNMEERCGCVGVCGCDKICSCRTNCVCD